jgi:transcriptional regulator with XRE-family HTH domain
MAGRSKPVSQWEAEAREKGDAVELEARRLTQEIGRAVRRTRIERAWSQEELAQKAGVARTTVQRLECGIGDIPSLRCLVKISIALGIHTRALFGEAEVVGDLVEFIRGAQRILDGEEARIAASERAYGEGRRRLRRRHGGH